MTDIQMDSAPATSTTTTTTIPATVLTRQCEAEPEFNYILLSVEMEPLAASSTATPDTAAQQQRRLQSYNLPILTFRKMLTSALQDLFGMALGGGLAVDILAYATPKDLQDSRSSSSYSLFSSLAHSSSSSSSSSTTSSSSSSSSSLSSTTTAYAVLRSAAKDLHPLWSALTLFNATVDDLDVRIHVHRTSSTLLALASSSRLYPWDQAPSFPSS